MVDPMNDPTNADGPDRPFRRRHVLAFVAVWLGAALAGHAALARYQAIPGAVLAPPAVWPANSRIERVPGRPALLLFAHPGCPCTRASVHELEWLITRFPTLAVKVIAIDPEGFSRVDDAGIVAAAASLPGVEVVRAPPAEADRFGVLTSGHALVFAADGRLLFSGGITSSRGHEGDNVGLERIAAILSGGTPDRRDSPVFGCALTERTRVP